MYCVMGLAGASGFSLVWPAVANYRVWRGGTANAYRTENSLPLGRPDEGAAEVADGSLSQRGRGANPGLFVCPAPHGATASARLL